MSTPISYRTPGVYVERLDVNPQYIELGRTDVAGFVGIAERGPVQAATKVESYRQFQTTFGARIANAYLAYAVEGFFANGGRTCWVVRVADPERAVPARVRLFVAGRRPFVLEAASPGTWGNQIEVTSVWGRDRITHVVARTLDGRTQPVDLDVLEAPARPAGSKAFTNLLGVSEDTLPELAREEVVRFAEDSPWVPSRELDARTRTVTLAGGADGLGSLAPDHFAGHPDREGVWGAAALDCVDNVSFVAVPDLMFGQDVTVPVGDFGGFGQDLVKDAQIRVITSCMRRRDRMAILDLPPARLDQVLAYRDKWSSSSFAAFYHPWLIVNDPSRVRDVVRTIPPSGHVAGMYARTARLRGVHKPPANEVLEGVCDVREQLDDRAHGDLNENSVNAIRAIPGRGVLVLGARTLDRDVRWRYVNVRRLFSAIEEALDERMQWLTFEPNNPRLWREIDRAVSGFLERLFRAGMLDGQTSEQAYSVRCDESTNPPWETDDGRVTCVIGLQPPYPAEFVVVRIGVTRNGIQVEEKGAQDV
jgi:phage tail sheath protein FI